MLVFLMKDLPLQTRTDKSRGLEEKGKGTNSDLESSASSQELQDETMKAVTITEKGSESSKQ